MLENKTESLSLCSSCKSELRSICSIGVPSYLDESICSMSSISRNGSQVQQITDNEIKAIRSASTPKKRNSPRDDVISNYLLKESIKNTHNNSLPTNKSSQMYILQKLNNVMYKQVHNFINLKNHKNMDNSEIYKEKILKSCNLNTQNIKPEPTFSIRSLERLKEIRKIMITTNKTKAQEAVSLKTLHIKKCALQNSINSNVTKTDFSNIKTQNVIYSKEKAFTLKNQCLEDVINPEVTETSLNNHRRNVYRLAVRVLKLSTYILDIQKVLLKKQLSKEMRAHEHSNIKHVSFKDNTSTTKSHTKNSVPQDLPMYSYNPLQICDRTKHISNK